MTGILEAGGVGTVRVSSPQEAESLKEAVLLLHVGTCLREGELEAGLPQSVLAPPHCLYYT